MEFKVGDWIFLHNGSNFGDYGCSMPIGIYQLESVESGIVRMNVEVYTGEIGSYWAAPKSYIIKSENVKLIEILYAKED